MRILEAAFRKNYMWRQFTEFLRYAEQPSMAKLGNGTTEDTHCTHKEDGRIPKLHGQLFLSVVDTRTQLFSCNHLDTSKDCRLFIVQLQVIQS